MKLLNLKDCKLGWFVGNFSPCIYSTEAAEVCIKRYKAGDYDAKHLHKIADEVTVIVEGEAEMNGVIYKTDDIILIEKNEETDFRALTNAITCVVKLPSVLGDKYFV